MINKKIQDIKIQYALPVYKAEDIEDVHNDDIQLTINDQLFLETLLMEIRGTISYASYRKKTTIKVKKKYLMK